MKDIQLEGGTYEILQGRLRKQGDDLRERLVKLNDERKDAFGAIESRLLTSDRITTESNCVPWDMVAIGDKLLFGYNIQFGLKTEIKIEDVLCFYTYDNYKFHAEGVESLLHPSFEDDFKNLYKYYKHTKFVKFAKRGTNLFMVFQTGKTAKDIKVFKWLITENNELQYQDARSEHEYKFPQQHEFEWKKTTREMHRSGEHPHISINDIVFIEAVGGDITIKVEDNTGSGKGIYSELVNNKDQKLDDADIYYAIVENLIFFKVLPYEEKEYRYIVYNAKIQQAERVDDIADACVLLPDNQGVIFPNGYYLQSGEIKMFDNELTDLVFERKVASPNGEDYLYIFYHPEQGVYLLLSYNIIEQGVATPIICHGFTFYGNGELCYFKADSEAKKHHAVQIWQTPYTHADFVVPNTAETYLSKIGNKEIVRAMAECYEVLNLLNKEDSYSGLYVDVLKKSNDLIDNYFWLANTEVNTLSEPLNEIIDTSKTTLGEFEKVVKVRKSTQKAFETLAEKATGLTSQVKRFTADSVNDFVAILAELRALRGEIIAVKEMRYADLEAIAKLEEVSIEQSEQMSQGCVEFLLKENSLLPYSEKVSELEKEIEEVTKVVEANETEQNIDASAKELELLIDVVSNLKIEDATQTTAIIDEISSIYAHYNKLRATLRQKRKSLVLVEGKLEFNAQMKLIDQGIINFLDLCDTAERCEEYMAKLMVQLEELEGKFAEFDEYINDITTKREEIYNAFDNKKLSLTEEHNRKANNLFQAGERILQAIKNRLGRFDDVKEINAYYASDLMIEKVRSVIENLTTLGDTVKADDIQSKLKVLREDAIRQLKDKKELFVDGENIISFGEHNFLVNTQKLALSMVQRDGEMYYHLAGTNFFEEVTDTIVLENKSIWNQSLISENDEVARAEYLAYVMYEEAKTSHKLEELNQLTYDDFLIYTQKIMALRYNEGYVKGIHDSDATKIVMELIRMHLEAKRLRYDAKTRVCASVYWEDLITDEDKIVFTEQLKNVGLIQNSYENAQNFNRLRTILLDSVEKAFANTDLFDDIPFVLVIDYLFEEIGHHESFVIDGESVTLFEEFQKELKQKNVLSTIQQSIKSLEGNVFETYALALNWVKAFSADSTNEFEIAKLLINGNLNKNQVSRVSVQEELVDFGSTHQQIEDGSYSLDFRTYIHKLNQYAETSVPAFESFASQKKELLVQAEEELRLSEFKPKVMSSFVRNQLIDKVYLPLIGANLAKQIGTAGEDKRTDLMGMLLLISPPGYGKTTLMEYIANRLGVVFMKINGPAIGHEITSVDPSQAKNAGEREELKKLNLAFEMGDNVMIYLDDIQHCNPEFLQKFISLCDGQRKIEGVYKGKPKTYDFRGKKVAVVMAGNPYTESGDKFQIPDMLANRADIYNLGDIIGGADDVFELSYLENSASSNKALQKIASKSHKDYVALIRGVEKGDVVDITFEVNHSGEDISDAVSVLKHLIKVRDIVLQVNQKYIYSASQADEYRVEPPFKLQGSYRNMNKLGEKLVPVMNDAELTTLILSHYEGESQTLTTGAEANLLKFKTIYNQATEEEAQRWKDIKQTYVKQNKSKLNDGQINFDDIVDQLVSINEGIRETSGGTTKDELLIELMNRLNGMGK